jgi:hypothetical protein
MKLNLICLLQELLILFKIPSDAFLIVSLATETCKDKYPNECPVQKFSQLSGTVC